MSNSPIIFKVKFYSPNIKADAAGSNAAHIKYIATRPGVEIGDMSIDRNVMSTSEQYIKYADERPGSCGLFGNNDDEVSLMDVMEELKEHEGIVWRSIISLREDDAVRLQYDNREQWEMKLRTMVPDIAKTMGISESNLRWEAAFHVKKGHPHVHLVFWEKIPQRTLGVIKRKERREIKRMLAREIFAEERSLLNAQKTAIRDLIKNMAKEDLTQTVKLIKDLKSNELDVTQLDGQVNSIPPLLREHQFMELSKMITELSSIMPTKGRIVLSYMPSDVKDKVKDITDYILHQPEFTAQIDDYKIKARELAKHYTRDKNKLIEAENNAYNDIRDRISQVILKAASENQKDNIFYIDKERSQKAVNFIKNMYYNINLIPEQTKVFNQIATILARTGYNDEKILKVLKIIIKEGNINYSEESIKKIISQIRESKLENQDISSLSSRSKVDYYLSALKLSGATEKEAFSHGMKLIKQDSFKIDIKLNELKNIGILKKQGEHYSLTNKGIEEILKIKDLDVAEKEIFKMLESDGEVNFSELIDNKYILDNLHDKDPEELKIGKFDTKVREVFGKDNKITLKGLEGRIYKKYTDDKLNINVEKAEQEFEILKNRIGKLTLNGYIELDKATGSYSFTEESESYFEYNEDNDSYTLSKNAIDIFDIPQQMEFTRYDANVTLSYIDMVKDGILTADQLRVTLDKEIINQTAQQYYAKFTELLNTNLIKKVKEYISIDNEGNLSSNEEGKWLGINLNKLNKYFKEAKGSLTDDKIKELCSTEKEYQKVSNILELQIKKGHIEKNQETGEYRVNPIINDINSLAYQIYKGGGTLNISNLKEILEKNIPNYDADKQFKYLTWRLDNLKEQGYLRGQDNEYQITKKGIEKRADILVPERDILRDTLLYLERLGLVVKSDKGYQATERYYKYMRDITIAKDKNLPRISEYISKDIYNMIDCTQDKISVGKIERSNERIAIVKYINGEYENIKTCYEDIRTVCGVADTITNTVNKVSTALLVSGVSLEDTREILYQWNIRANCNIEKELLNDIIDKTHKVVIDNKLWGRTTVISTKDWKDMFKSLGVQDNNMPQWIYMGVNWQSPNFVSGIWRSAWRAIEREKAKTQAKTEKLKRKLEMEDPHKESRKSVWEINLM